MADKFRVIPDPEPVPPVTSQQQPSPEAMKRPRRIANPPWPLPNPQRPRNKIMDKHRCSTASPESTQPGCGDLIARLEAASEGDGELSWRVAEYLGWAKIWDGLTIFLPPGEWADKARRDPMSVSVVDLPGDLEGAGQSFPEFTTSLDAALTLLPEEMPADIHIGPHAIYNQVTVYRKAQWLDEQGRRYTRWEPAGIAGGPKDGKITANTPALAVCIAALKARAASVPQTGPVELSERSNTDSSPNPVAQPAAPGEGRE